MDSLVSQNGSTVSIPEIQGQTTETITWILRGDKVGEYYFSADYSGFLSEFNVPISAVFEAADPITVSGLSDVAVEIKVPNAIQGGLFYYNVKATNNGSEAVYMPVVETLADPEMTFFYDADGNNMLGTNDKIASSVSEDLFREDEVAYLQPGQSMEMHYIMSLESYGRFGDSILELQTAVEDILKTPEEMYGLQVTTTTIPVFDANTMLTDEFMNEFGHPIGNFIGADYNLYYNGEFGAEQDHGMKANEHTRPQDYTSGDDSYLQYNHYPFTYSDAFFNQSSMNNYNHKFATYCMSLAFAAYNGNYAQNDRNITAATDNRDANVKNMLLKSGFKEETYDQSGYDELTDINTMAVAFAQKEVNGEIVLAVVVRGGNYGREWGGDFLVGSSAESEEHKGFLIAKEYVLNSLNQYLGKSEKFSNPLHKKVKLMITGYSRGAATANLVAAEIDDIISGDNTAYGNIKNLNTSLNDVYAYTFETPRNTTDVSVHASRYKNIYNFVNPMDFVPKVAFEVWNFERYGTDIYAPGPSTASSFASIYSTTKFQFNVVTGIPFPYYLDSRKNMTSIV